MLKAYWLIYYTNNYFKCQQQPAKQTLSDMSANQCSLLQNHTLIIFEFFLPYLVAKLDTHYVREEEYGEFKLILQYIKCFYTLEYLTCIDEIYLILSY